MNYYNENEPQAVAWLGELIDAKLIPPGKIDSRSITDVTPSDLLGFTQHHFFAGIGGWSLALAIAGWPTTKPVWTGSCPCQPFSVAGKRKGDQDERHLWPVFFELIKACKPPVIFGEQVANSLTIGSSNEKMQRLLKDQKAYLVSDLRGQKHRRAASFMHNVPAELREEMEVAFQGETSQGAVDSFSESESVCADLPLFKQDSILGCGKKKVLREKGDSIRSGQASSGNSEPHECRGVRIDGLSTESDPAELQERIKAGRPVNRQNHSREGIHSEQHPDRLSGGEFCDVEMGRGRLSSDSENLGKKPINELTTTSEPPESEFKSQIECVWIDGIFTDLEGASYSCAAADLCAASIGAPHIRQRLYWVADTNGWHTGAEREQCCREQRFFTKGCGLGGMADGIKPGLERHAGHGDRGDEPGRLDAHQAGPTTASGGAGGMGNAGRECDELGRGAGDVGRAPAQEQGEAQERERSGNADRDSGAHGAWEDCDWIPCRDGKSRRVESGTFPLVAGLPKGMVPSGDPSSQEVQATAEGRVMRLKGYGNSIIPQLAAVFIQSFMEISTRVTDQKTK